MSFFSAAKFHQTILLVLMTLLRSFLHHEMTWTRAVFMPQPFAKNRWVNTAPARDLVLIETKKSQWELSLAAHVVSVRRSTLDNSIDPCQRVAIGQAMEDRTFMTVSTSL
jgi:hypothetical protein